MELYEDIYEGSFSFGRNWRDFLQLLDKTKIDQAKEYLAKFLQVKDLKDKTFIDIGCGSGLFSLAAVMLGAKQVVSIDVDTNSVACAKVLKKRYAAQSTWDIKKGSILDKRFVATLPQSDIVYSWGVLHHTGRMYEAIDNSIKLTKKDGLFYIAIYNTFNGLPFSSAQWVKIKRFYGKQPRFIKKVLHVMYATMVLAGVTLSGKNPYRYVKEYGKNALRGMDFYTDIIDWLGGYPYEHATAEEMIDYFTKKGATLQQKNLTVRDGCNEFLFKF